MANDSAQPVSGFTADDVKELAAKLPDPPTFNTMEEIENLTEDQAYEVLRAIRRKLAVELLTHEYHEHMLDDCGDDLQAATENWTYMHNVYFDNDGDRDALIKGAKAYLLAGYEGRRANIHENPQHDPFAPSYGGCDGEVRYDLLSEALQAEITPEEGTA